MTACANQLRICAVSLAELKIQTGRHCTICIEPEPGCILDTAEDTCQFFNEYLFTGSDAETVRIHIGVCHDVCHSAVMFEHQADAVQAYAQSGITIGKVQVSSAVEVDFQNLDDQEKLESLRTLSEFSEPKYLHQTCIKRPDETIFFSDLAEAIDAHPDPEGVWRIHFHVPIFASSLGQIGQHKRRLPNVSKHWNRRLRKIRTLTRLCSHSILKLKLMLGTFCRSRIVGVR